MPALAQSQRASQQTAGQTHASGPATAAGGNARGNAAMMEDSGLSGAEETNDWSAWANDTAGLTPSTASPACAAHGAEGHQCSAECDHAAVQSAIDTAYQEVGDDGGDAPPPDSADTSAMAGATSLPEPDNAGAPGPELAVGYVEGKVGAGFPQQFGLTKPGADVTAPKLNIRVERRKRSMLQSDYFAAIIEPTTASDGHDTAWATPAGWHDAGTITGKDGVDYTQKLEVTPSDAATLEQAEGEHLSDIAYAYEITVGAVADAINANTNDEFWGDTEAEARANALAVVNSGLPGPLQAKFAETIGLQAVIQRHRLVAQNPRDENQWHDAHTLPQDGDAVDLDRRTIKMRLDLPKSIGTVPSSALFKV